MVKIIKDQTQIQQEVHVRKREKKIPRFIVRYIFSILFDMIISFVFFFFRTTKRGGWDFPPPSPIRAAALPSVPAIRHIYFFCFGSHFFWVINIGLIAKFFRSDNGPIFYKQSNDLTCKHSLFYEFSRLKFQFLFLYHEHIFWLNGI